MTAITFDTLEYASKLRSAGFPEEQAEALARVQKDALSEALDTALATKGDIASVREDVARLDKRFQEDISKLDKQLLVIKWMLALVIAVTVLPALKTLFGL